MLFAGLGGLAITIPSFKFLTTSFESATMNIVRSELSTLTLDEQSLQKFATDFAKSKDRSYRFTIQAYSLLKINSARSGKVNQLVTLFLLSSDFFQNKMNETRTVKYVALYNPYTRPCSHPFSHVHYE